MTKAQIYKPAPRWPAFAALVGALTIEFTALAVASLQKELAPVVPGFSPPQPIEAEFIASAPEAAPPDTQPPPLPPPPDVVSEFEIAEPVPPHQPPPKPRTNRGGQATFASAQTSLTNAPRPVYPYEARRSRQTGSGRFLLHFDSNGAVTDVEIDRSTGSAVLDQISESTFRRWRCQPGACRAIYVPVTFTLNGAQF